MTEETKETKEIEEVKETETENQTERKHVTLVDGALPETEGEKKRRMRRMGKLADANFGTFLMLGIILILCAKIVFDFTGFRSFLSEAVSYIGSILSYLVFGFVLAYVLNAYMMWLEKVPLKKMKPTKGKRYLSIFLSYLTLTIFVGLLVFAMVPKLIESITNFAKMVPGLAEKLTGLYNDLVSRERFDLPESVTEAILRGIDGAKEFLLGFLNADRLTSFGTKIVTATGAGIFRVVMGVLVSVYMLLEKDQAHVASKRIVSGMFKPAKAARIFDAAGKVDGIFKRYFTGKLLQCIIILILSYIVLLIGGIDYAILFAFILGFTNMIPYIGPWIGGIPTVAICLVQNPWMGIKAFICVIVIQMIDNWFITPNVVGGKMGISPLLVLIGLCVGGSLFGFVGMIIGDVLAAIVKVFFYDGFIARKLKKYAAETGTVLDEPPEEEKEELTAPERITGAFKKISARIRKKNSKNRKK